MSAMSDAVKNGPRMTGARTAHIDAQIKLAEARAKTAHDKAAGLRRRAKGDGPLAKSRQLRAASLEGTADRHRARANQLRADLAKAKADEAARHVKHVKRTVASTAAEGLTPKVAGQARPPGRTKTGGGGHVAKRRMTHQSGANQPSTITTREEFFRDSAILDAGPRQPRQARRSSTPPKTTPPTKGTPAMTVSGEAVNIEQTRSNLDQLKGQVADLRGSFEGISGSLASGGLNQLAGSLASADDSLDSVLTQITAAEKHLSDQEAIAEAAQAAGEMHSDASFYGA